PPPSLPDALPILSTLEPAILAPPARSKHRKGIMPAPELPALQAAICVARSPESAACAAMGNSPSALLASTAPPPSTNPCAINSRRVRRRARSGFSSGATGSRIVFRWLIIDFFPHFSVDDAFAKPASQAAVAAFNVCASLHPALHMPALRVASVLG